MNFIETEKQKFLPPDEVYFRETGVHRHELNDGTKITGVSANSWEEYVEMLNLITPEDKLVVSPELITHAGGSFVRMWRFREIVNTRLDWMLGFSEVKRDTIFIVGTPLFLDEGKPRNSAVLIKNGEIIGVTNKRSGATIEERENFELVAEEPPFIIPGTNTSLLICADLPTASLYASVEPRLITRNLELSGRKYLIGKDVKLIYEDTSSVLVISCWGVGGSWVRAGEADEYYRYQLRNFSWRLMRDTNVQEIAVVDRVPIAEDMSLTPLYPYNGVIRMME